MRLSTKYTDIFVVVITWPTAAVEAKAFGKLHYAQHWLAARQKELIGHDVYIQLHKIQQALPQEPERVGGQR